jgi:hypothetical protein
VTATAEEWNTHWYRIKEDALTSGMDERAAGAVADQETAEQFGPGPEEAA